MSVHSTRSNPKFKRATLLIVSVFLVLCTIVVINVVTSSASLLRISDRQRMATQAEDQQHQHPMLVTTTKSATVASPTDDSKQEHIPDSSSSLQTPPQQRRRTVTDTGIAVDDPALYTSIDLHGDSSTATVMGMASGYDINVYKGFVGPLRKSGFKGNIILGVSPDVSEEILAYFRHRKVTPKVMQWVNCTYADANKEGDIFKETECAHPYPDIKIRWSRFPLARDWLLECEACTGPVLLMDVRDSLFQLDPFGPGSPVIKGLQVYQEDPAQTTQHWLTKWPIGDCKGIDYNETMLCSGTTTGTRAAMIKYLEIMYAEMKEWISNPKCRFDINGDDQSIHNYLYYSGQLPFATSVPNRQGGIVNTVGVPAAKIFKAHVAEMMEKHKLGQYQAAVKPFAGSSGNQWLGSHWNMIDHDGFFTEMDGTRSRVVHQYDRFGQPYMEWLSQQNWYGDSATATATDEVTATTHVDGEEEEAKGSADEEEEGIRAITADKKAKVGSPSEKQRGSPLVVDAAVPRSPEERLKKTFTGIDLTDPELYAGVDLHGDSSTATVMGMASGYDLGVYQRFVGSLRNSGFKGHIILGVAPDVSQEVLEYFSYRNVTPKVMKWVDCTYSDANKKDDIFKKTQCADPYPDIKIRWSRFPLARDWLSECATCTGPVLIMDVRDSLFQLDPFGPGSPLIEGLQVYQEDPTQTTQHWLTKWPIGTCKGIEYNETMLCSGTTTGTRAAMLKYLEIMYAEMKEWIEDPSCRFDINGDDQSIHNYLFYSGQLPFATSVPNRGGGIVNTVGVPAAKILKEHNKKHGDSKAHNIPFDGAEGNRWIGKHFNMTDDEGFFIEADGRRSRVIHQYDRFGFPYIVKWLKHQSFAKDTMELAKAAGASSETRDLSVVKVPLTSPPVQVDPERKTTDAGVDVSDPELYDGVDLNGDSSTATVMGMASGYSVDVYHRFVGSLRKTGYKGHIILGVAPDIDERSLKYLRYRNVTIKFMEWVNCTYASDNTAAEKFLKERTRCAHPYPDIKIRWSRFPLARDWLRECETCTGSVLIMDVRDSFFQVDPFGPGSPVIKGLQVYEEHRNQTLAHWITSVPIGGCKGLKLNGTMLCSGTTTGTRAAMLRYLDAMYAEMKVWIENPRCRFSMNGDDQSIHNYLYYTGQLPFAKAMVNRGGGIVNTVGVEGAIIAKRHAALMLERHNKTQGDAMWMPFDGAGGQRWIGVEFNMTDDEGFFTEFDGSRSRVIHQWDRFGRPFVNLWLPNQDFVKDSVPVEFE